MNQLVGAAAGLLGLHGVRRLKSAQATLGALASEAPPDILLVHWSPAE